jgi:hypothetical protein
VIKAPVRVPRPRAHAERWVGTVRRECPDRLLILGRRHLEHVLAIYTRHYNEHRPHRSLRQPLLASAASEQQVAGKLCELGRLRRRDRLGGLIHEYRLARSRQLPRSPRRFCSRAREWQIAPNCARGCPRGCPCQNDPMGDRLPTSAMPPDQERRTRLRPRNLDIRHPHAARLADAGLDRAPVEDAIERILRAFVTVGDRYAVLVGDLPRVEKADKSQLQAPVEALLTQGSKPACRATISRPKSSTSSSPAPPSARSS